MIALMYCWLMLKTGQDAEGRTQQALIALI